MAYPDADSARRIVRFMRREAGFAWRWRASF
jgi:hypothetical protein